MVSIQIPALLLIVFSRHIHCSSLNLRRFFQNPARPHSLHFVSQILPTCPREVCLLKKAWSKDLPSPTLPCLVQERCSLNLCLSPRLALLQYSRNQHSSLHVCFDQASPPEKAHCGETISIHYTVLAHIQFWRVIKPFHPQYQRSDQPRASGIYTNSHLAVFNAWPVHWP